MAMAINMSSEQILCSIITALAIHLIYKITYRVFFHPLRDFPGPKLAAATFLYEKYFDILLPPYGQYVFHLDRLHEQYGPVVRCSPDEIHVSDSSFFNNLYTGPGKVRDRWSRSIRSNGAPGAVISALPHKLHQSRRAALAPFFSKRTVQALESSIRDKVEVLSSTLSQSARRQEVVELGTAFAAVTLDVITEYCYDKCSNCLEEEDYGARWKVLMREFADALPVSKHLPLYATILQSMPGSVVGLLNPVFLPLFDLKKAIALQARKVWMEEDARKKSHEKIEEERRSTVFHGILQSSLPESEKAMWRLSDEAFVLVTAGGEMTARVLATTMSYLLQDKALYIRLRSALDGIVSHAGLPPSHQLEEIPLVKAVIQEGLRIADTVTGRQVLIAPDEDLVCGNWVIPRGTPTSMSYRNVNFDEKIFPDPYKFIPDRWIRAVEQGHRLDQYLVTFAKGSRNCAGENLAWAEMYFMIAAIVTRFDLELVDFDRARDLDVVRDCLLGMPSKASKGVRVKITVRE